MYKYINNTTIYISNTTINLLLNNPPTQIAPAAPMKKQLATIEEGENEIGEGTLMTSINGETLTVPTLSNYGLNGTKLATESSDKIGENVNEEENKTNTELEHIKRQIRGILNKITGENFDKLSFEIANILKISDIAASELKGRNVSTDELYKLQKSKFKALIKLIFKCILSKAINEIIFSNQYSGLCYSLYCFVENNEFLKKLFRQQLLGICHNTFTKTRLNNENNKFIGIIAMIGELYHYGLISSHNWNWKHRKLFKCCTQNM